MGTIYVLVLGTFFGLAVRFFWVPRCGFGLALGFSDRDLVAEFMPPDVVKTADEQHQSDIPATYRLGWGFICSDLAHVLVSRRANYVWQRLLDP